MHFSHDTAYDNNSMRAPLLLKNLVVLIPLYIFAITTPFAFAQQYYSSYTISTDVGHPTNSGPPPNTNTCGGVYDLTNPDNHDVNLVPLVLKNYADPNCELVIISPQGHQDPFNHVPIDSIIYQLDPKYAITWIHAIIPTESGYDANIVEHHCYHPTCAWGLFQMSYIGISANHDDVGSVYWKQQITNALHLNQDLNRTYGGTCGALGTACPPGKPQTWCYWASAPQSMLCEPL